MTIPRHSLEALLGHPELVRIAQYDVELAIDCRALLDLLEEADFANAETAVREIGRRVRSLRLSSSCDAAGFINKEHFRGGVPCADPSRSLTQNLDGAPGSGATAISTSTQL